MKKILFLCVVAAMAVACGKDDKGPKLPHVPAPPVISENAAPYILYMDGTKLSLGRWGVVTQANMIFTKFGSVVGFTSSGNTDTWDAADVKFNTTATTNYATYGAIKCWLSGPTTDGYISSAAYHNDDNLAEGRGDICKLVGLTSAQARELAAADMLDEYDSGFRLPTRVESVDFVAAPTANYEEYNVWYLNSSLTFWGTNGTKGGAWFPVPGNREIYAGRTTLNTDPAGFPAAGDRQPTSGASTLVGIYGRYWTGTAHDVGIGYYLMFNDEFVDNDEHNESRMSPVWTLNKYSGASVRCVPAE